MADVPAAQPFCEDCKFFRPSQTSPEDLNLARCMYPQRMAGLMLVGRAAAMPPRLCRLERQFSGDNSCSPDGKWFQPKDAG